MHASAFTLACIQMYMYIHKHVHVQCTCILYNVHLYIHMFVHAQPQHLCTTHDILVEEVEHHSGQSAVRPVTMYQ